MATVTGQGISRAVERDPCWLIFDADWSGDVGSTSLTLRSLPVDTVILDAFVNCVTAETGTGAADVDIKAGTTQWFTGTADNGGTANVYDAGASKFHHVVTSSTTSLIAEYVDAGTGVTGPVMRIGVLVHRPNF
jgi:hypothetical protein